MTIPIVLLIYFTGLIVSFFIVGAINDQSKTEKEKFGFGFVILSWIGLAFLLFLTIIFLCVADDAPKPGLKTITKLLKKEK